MWQAGKVIGDGCCCRNLTNLRRVMGWVWGGGGVESVSVSVVMTNHYITTYICTVYTVCTEEAFEPPKLYPPTPTPYLKLYGYRYL